MKNNAPYSILLLITLVLGSCTSLKNKQQANAIKYPALGAIIKTQGALWFYTTEQVGTPNWQDTKVTVTALPFTKERYGRYSKMLERSNTANTIPYNDSLPFKPKYARLQLLDKITLTAQLNHENNATVRQYLEQDADFKLVTSLDVALNEGDIALLNQATSVQLTHDDYGALILNVVSGQEERYFTFSDLPIFDMGFSSFCWGEDRYHQLLVQNITPEGERCPRGTYAKSKKVADKRDYLKL